MAFERTKKGKNGKLYRYLVRSVRVPGRRTPKQEIIAYLGAAGGGRIGGFTETPEERRRRQEQQEEYAREMATVHREAQEFDEWQRKTFGETGQERADREQQEKLDQLHEDFGLTVLKEEA